MSESIEVGGLKATAIERRFNYNGVALPDPGPGMSVEQVKEFYSTQYPDLSTATFSGPTEKEGKLEYTFTRAIGTKG